MAAAVNHLIETLPRKDRTHLLAACESFELTLSEVLSEYGKPLRHVYFPTEGFISLVTQIDDHPVLEVGMVGQEGMLGSSIALGVDTSPLNALVQGTGLAWRLEATAFRRELMASPALSRTINRYLSVLMAQMAATAACLHFHLIGPRLARWLLMSHDRAHGDSFHVTHEFLSYMLGVRRVGITMAAGALQRSGVITYHRGQLTVLDRPGLEAASCACYAADRQLYINVM